MINYSSNLFEVILFLNLESLEFHFSLTRSSWFTIWIWFCFVLPVCDERRDIIIPIRSWWYTSRSICPNNRRLILLDIQSLIRITCLAYLVPNVCTILYTIILFLFKPISNVFDAKLYFQKYLENQVQNIIFQLFKLSSLFIYHLHLTIFLIYLLYIFSLHIGYTYIYSFTLFSIIFSHSLRLFPFNEWKNK